MSLRNIVLGAAAAATMYSTDANAQNRPATTPSATTPQRLPAAAAPATGPFTQPKKDAFAILTCEPFAEHAADFCDPARVAAEAQKRKARAKAWGDFKLGLDNRFTAIDNHLNDNFKRINDHFTAVDNELGGTYAPNVGYTDSRIDNTENKAWGLYEYFNFPSTIDQNNNFYITLTPNENSPFVNDLKQYIQDALAEAQKENDKQYASQKDLNAVKDKIKTLDRKQRSTFSSGLKIGYAHESLEAGVTSEWRPLANTDLNFRLRDLGLVLEVSYLNGEDRQEISQTTRTDAGDGWTSRQTTTYNVLERDYGTAALGVRVPMIDLDRATIGLNGKYGGIVAEAQRTATPQTRTTVEGVNRTTRGNTEINDPLKVDHIISLGADLRFDYVTISGGARYRIAEDARTEDRALPDSAWTADVNLNLRLDL